MEIDLNADLGEGCGSDEALLDLVSSANIACGWHAGGANAMRDCVRWAVAKGVADWRASELQRSREFRPQGNGSAGLRDLRGRAVSARRTGGDREGRRRPHRRT